MCNRNKPNRKYPSKTFRKPLTASVTVSQVEKPIKEIPEVIPPAKEVTPPPKETKKKASKSKKATKSVPTVVPDKVDSEPEEKVEKEEKEKSKKDKKSKDKSSKDKEKEKDNSEKDIKELAACSTVITLTEEHDDAWPFVHPVNTKQFPTYKKIIKKPMDIQTIKSRLDAGT